VPSGVIVMPTDFYGKSSITNTQKAIFGFGSPAPGSQTSITNLVSSSGVVASNTPGVGTARSSLAAATYGVDKAIFGFGSTVPASNYQSITNLVSNTGVVASDTPGVGTASSNRGCAGYGGDKAIFGFGSKAGPAPNFPTAQSNATNLVSNTGVVASDTPTVGTARQLVTGVTYGGDKALFISSSIVNLVSNTGVVASDTPVTPGAIKTSYNGAGYGGDKAILAFGQAPSGPVAGTNTISLISNTGVIAAATPGAGTVRIGPPGAGYGGDKAIFAFGSVGSPSPTTRPSINNLVSNTGVLASDTSNAGTGRAALAAAGYSISP
jgi:hypothetical protein